MNRETNLHRFKAFYGKPSQTLVAMFVDSTNAFPSVSRKDLLMTMNWFTIYDMLPVLAGRWGYSEHYIGPKVKECGKMIQSIMPRKIHFHLVIMIVYMWPVTIL